MQASLNTQSSEYCSLMQEKVLVRAANEQTVLSEIWPEHISKKKQMTLFKQERNIRRVIHKSVALKAHYSS